MKRKILFLLPALMLSLTSCSVDDNGEFHLTWVFWLTLIVVLISLLFGSVAAKDEEKKQESIKEELNQAAKAYHGSAEVTGIKHRFKMIFDDQQKRIVIVYPGSNVKFIKFPDIRGVELVEDGTILQSKSMMRTVGGAIVGNMVAGGAGAIIGGLSGDSKQKKKISSVDVILKLRGLSEPTYTINCFSAQEFYGKKEIKSDEFALGDVYREGLKDANRIVELVGVVIDANDREQKEADSKATASVSSSSDIEALEKLVSMKEKGLLTDQEFESMKSKLISKN